MSSNIKIFISSVDGGQIGGQITNSQREILKLIVQNLKISRKQLREHLQINQSAIQKQIAKLVLQGVMTRIGGTRGFWLINTEQDILFK